MIVDDRFFLDETTGQVLKMGDTLKLPALAETLKMIARHGVDIFYRGALGDMLIDDVTKKGGILTKEDLIQYRSVESTLY